MLSIYQVVWASPCCDLLSCVVGIHSRCQLLVPISLVCTYHLAKNLANNAICPLSQPICLRVVWSGQPVGDLMLVSDGLYSVINKVQPPITHQLPRCPNLINTFS